MSHWTVDVCILEAAEKGDDDDRTFNCAEFIYKFARTKDYICIDVEGVMVELYKKRVNIHNPSTSVGKWWKKMQHNNRIFIAYTNLNKRIIDKLEEMGFDEDDLIYIKVAKNTPDRRLVSIDSDFGCRPESDRNRDDIKKYLESDAVSIRVFTPLEALG